MFRALGKYTRAFFYLITFRINKASETLRMNPGVISANYDRIITEKRGRINQYKDAIASMIAQEESKKQKLQAVTAEIEKLEKLKSGAAAKARKIAEKHGNDPAATKADGDYQRCQNAFSDFSSTLLEKQRRADELENDLKELLENINGHKVNIQSQMRELERLAEEKHDAVATVMSVTEEKQIADMISGLSEDRTSEELRELRELRNKASAEAKMSREIAGLDTRRAEEEFMDFASSSEANDEFDRLIGLAGKEDAGGDDASKDGHQRNQIPEN